MKKISFLLLLLVPLIIMGCNQEENVFDNNELREELKREGINPKLPTKFSVTILEYERSIPPHKTNIYEVTFKGEDGEQFSLTINDSKAVEYNKLKKEDVIINENSDFYIEEPGLSLYCTEDDYHYILQYYTKEKGAKEIMIKIANSFR